MDRDRETSQLSWDVSFYVLDFVSFIATLYSHPLDS